jgi:DNA polymerase-3 subunit chi
MDTRADPNTEILFYHLERHTLERVLPTLLEKSIERGWRAAVQGSSEERIDALDQHLWTYREDSFLPHGTDRQGDAAAQPVLLTVDAANRNAAHVRFLIDGAQMPADAEQYERIVLIFDGRDEDAVAAARTCWTDSKSKGLAVTYWQADDQGRWRRKA